MKHLYHDLEDGSVQLSIVNRCILNLYYTYDESKVRPHRKPRHAETFCGVLAQLQDYSIIFRPTSLIKEKSFNNMQRRVRRDIIDMKIKGEWINEENQ